MMLVLTVVVLFASLAYADMIALPGPPGFNGAGFGALAVDVPLTLVIELAVSLVYLSIKKLPKKILISVVVANIISLTFLEILLSAFSGGLNYFFGRDYYFGIFLLEVLVVIFEAIVIFYMNKKEIKKKDAFVMSLLNNSASFFLGFAIYLVIAGAMYPPKITPRCEFSMDLYCIDYSINSTGNLTLVLRQETGHPITITEFNCTSNDNPAGVTTPLPNPIKINNGEQAVVINGTPCYKQSGDIATGHVGNFYTGKLFIRYNETDTDFVHGLAGNIFVRYI